MGAYASVMNNTSGTMFCKYGPDLEVAELILNIIGDIAAFIPEIGEGIELVCIVGETVIQIINIINAAQMASIHGNIQQWFQGQGYASYGPNDKDQSPKVTLSLVMTAHCATLIDVGNGKAELRIGDMTVWSGSTNNSVREYNVTDCPWGEITSTDENLALFKVKLGDNLVKNKEAVAEIRKQIMSKGKTVHAKPGVEPGTAGKVE